MGIGPIATFLELHPPGTAFVSCTSRQEVGLVYAHDWQAEAASGAIISCLGEMPAICHFNAATEVALDFFSMSGIEPPTRLETYRSNHEAEMHARRFAAAGLRLASIFPHTAGIGALNASLVSPQLYNYLNNKRNLSALCPPSVVPARRIYGRDAVPDLHASALRFPLFVKGAVDGASGGGSDVRFCSNDSELRDALSWFRSTPVFSDLIVEIAVPFTATWCLNFAILENAVRYLGAAEQLFASPGQQSGSLIDPDCQPGPEAVEIGMEICASAQGRGYRGLAGLDMCIDAEGGHYFFDLNFRMVGSTCLALLHGAMDDPRQVSLLCTFDVPGKLTDLLPRIAGHARAGRFIPVLLFDGSNRNSGAVPSRVRGIVQGRARAGATALAHDVRDRLAR